MNRAASPTIRAYESHRTGEHTEGCGLGAPPPRRGAEVMAGRLVVSGDWPGRITLRQGWARAVARPWNDELPDASLRLVRGSAAFVRACAEHLCSTVVQGVTSPPLLGTAERPWRRAGFEPYLTLHLYRRSLSGGPQQPGARVKWISHPDWRRLAEVDAAAFDQLWAMNSLGLQEAFEATPRAGVLVTDEGPDITGFAIVGVGGNTGYLQRIAVRPERRRAGLGRALVRMAMSWAATRGALSMMLNTQPDNHTSASLYVGEGFSRMPSDLAVLRWA